MADRCGGGGQRAAGRAGQTLAQAGKADIEAWFAFRHETRAATANRRLAALRRFACLREQPSAIPA